MCRPERASVRSSSRRPRSRRAAALLVALFLEGCASTRAPFESAHGEAETESMDAPGWPGWFSERHDDTPPTPREPRERDEPDKRPVASPFAELAILREPGAGERYFSRYGVNPTVDTRELDVVALPLEAPGASFALTRALLTGGQLPEPEGVRPEDFASWPARQPAAIAEPIAVSASLLRSISRPGGLALVVEARAGGPEMSVSGLWNRIVVLADVSGGRDESFVRLEGTLRAIAETGGGAAAVVPFATGSPGSPRPRKIADALPLVPGPAPSFAEALEQARAITAGARVLVLARGAMPVGLDSRAVRAASRIAEAGGSVSALALDEGAFSEPALDALVQAGRGIARFVSLPEEALAAIEAARAPLVATRAALEVRFDPERIARYRLVGHERALVNGRGQPGAGGALRAGDVVRAVFELELQPGASADGRPLAFVRARCIDENGARREAETHAAELDESTAPEAVLALLYTAFSERLRQTWWARGVRYEDLLARVDALPASLRAHDDARLLRELLERARELDRRPDPFAGEPPLAEAGLSSMPVLAPGREPGRP